MTNEFAEIEKCCVAVVRDAAELLNWEWDDNFGAALATFPVDKAPQAQAILETHFAWPWDHEAIADAPDGAVNVAEMLGGIRPAQRLYTTGPEEDVIAYAAWWPWGTGETISVRIGLFAGSAAGIGVATLFKKFRSWFEPDEG